MLKGSLVALVTPFDEFGNVDYDKLLNLINYHSENSDGIVLIGTTGEATTLTDSEQEEIVRFTVKHLNKRVPLIVGAGSNNTKRACELAKKYSSMGADYLLTITPYYNKTNESGLIKHFEAIAASSSCPLILYNVPGRTGMSISLHALEVLSKNPNIYGIKEASGNMSYAVEVSKLLSDDFIMLSGNDDLIVPMMSIGSMGVISVLANIAPKRTSEMCHLCLENKYTEAIKIQRDLLGVTNALFYETNPIPVKEAMNYLGNRVGYYRLPLDRMSEGNRERLINELDKKKGGLY